MNKSSHIITPKNPFISLIIMITSSNYIEIRTIIHLWSYFFVIYSLYIELGPFRTRRSITRGIWPRWYLRGTPRQDLQQHINFSLLILQVFLSLPNFLILQVVLHQFPTVSMLYHNTQTHQQNDQDHEWLHFWGDLKTHFSYL